MIMEILAWGSAFMPAIPAAWLGWQARKHVEKKPPKPKLASGKTEADYVKAGWKAVEQIATEVHRLYHPVDCKCVMCQITADDDDPDPNRYTGEFCSQPCFGCTVLTCKTHPDRKPQATTAKTAGDIQVLRGGFKNGHNAEYWEREAGMWQKALDARNKEVAELQRVLQDVTDNNDLTYLSAAMEERSTLKTQVRNLDSQLKVLGDSLTEVTKERDQLKDMHGLQSAGFHIGGRPTYTVEPDYDSLADRVVHLQNPKGSSRSKSGRGI